MQKQADSPVICRQDDPVLILEDIKENQDLLKALCAKMELNYRIAENGKEGLDLMEKEKFSLYIVDLMMPVMDGQTFIKKLKAIQPDAVILIQTALDASETIIETMKTGVFDYIIKPIDPELFQKTIRKALEFKNLKDLEASLSSSASLKVRNQLEWLNYKEDKRISAREYAGIKSIYNLKTSLTQGTGFGSLLTIVDIINHSKKDNGDSYLLDKEILDLLNTNFETCKTQLKGLHDISNLLESELPFEEYDAVSLISSLPEMLKEAADFFKHKKLEITYPELKSNCRLKINYEKLSLILEELVINAYKYSVPGTTVNIFSYIKESYLWLCIMNKVAEKPYGGIPQKYEKLVLEPFFRILPPDETIGKIEKYGIGLGLTVVDNIARKHGGMFLIHDVKDHTEKEVKTSVLAEILLPVAVE